MILGALIDAGVKLEDVRRALGSLAITPDTVWTEPVVRAGIRATKFSVRGETHPVDGHHDHDHHREHAHASHGQRRHRTDKRRDRTDMSRRRTNMRQPRTEPCPRFFVSWTVRH